MDIYRHPQQVPRFHARRGNVVGCSVCLESILKSQKVILYIFVDGLLEFRACSEQISITHVLQFLAEDGSPRNVELVSLLDVLHHLQKF